MLVYSNLREVDVDKMNTANYSVTEKLRTTISVIRDAK
jgi:hypothetical protein